jgi:hypothetical protein
MLRKAWRDFNGKWVLLDKSITITASNVPEWLSKIIRDVGENLDSEIIPGHEQLSDHQSFTLSGFVATNMATGGINYNDVEDTLDKVHRESLQKAGDIVVNMILRTMKRF